MTEQHSLVSSKSSNSRSNDISCVENLPPKPYYPIVKTIHYREFQKMKKSISNDVCFITENDPATMAGNRILRKLRQTTKSNIGSLAEKIMRPNGLPKVIFLPNFTNNKMSQTTMTTTTMTDKEKIIFWNDTDELSDEFFTSMNTTDESAETCVSSVPPRSSSSSSLPKRQEQEPPKPRAPPQAVTTPTVTEDITKIETTSFERIKGKTTASCRNDVSPRSNTDADADALFDAPVETQEILDSLYPPPSSCQKRKQKEKTEFTRPSDVLNVMLTAPVGRVYSDGTEPDVTIPEYLPEVPMSKQRRKLNERLERIDEGDVWIEHLEVCGNEYRTYFQSLYTRRRRTCPPSGTKRIVYIQDTIKKEMSKPKHLQQERQQKKQKSSNRQQPELVAQVEHQETKKKKNHRFLSRSRRFSFVRSSSHPDKKQPRDGSMSETDDSKSSDDTASNDASGIADTKVKEEEKDTPMLQPPPPLRRPGKLCRLSKLFDSKHKLRQKYVTRD